MMGSQFGPRLDAEPSTLVHDVDGILRDAEQPRDQQAAIDFNGGKSLIEPKFEPDPEVCGPLDEVVLQLSHEVAGVHRSAVDLALPVHVQCAMHDLTDALREVQGVGQIAAIHAPIQRRRLEVQDQRAESIVDRVRDVPRQVPRGVLSLGFEE